MKQLERVNQKIVRRMTTNELETLIEVLLTIQYYHNPEALLSLTIAAVKEINRRRDIARGRLQEGIKLVH